VATKSKRKVNDNNTVAGQSIITGVKQAIAWVNGEAVGARETVVNIPKVNVRRLRKKLHLSQSSFAAKFGFPEATIRNWEQGRREPELAARILLAVIDRRPEVVEEILRRKISHFGAL
jgi:putative transcriptional regulator